MSFRERSESLKPPDAKKYRSSSERPTSPASGSNIPVLERRKVFEQTDYGGERLSVSGSKRGSSRQSRKGDSGLSRSGSFRSKKPKNDSEVSLARNRQTSSSALSKARFSFGYYDTQSMMATTMASEQNEEGGGTRKLKGSGASAVHLSSTDESQLSSSDVSNDLVATCPFFRNEIDGNWMMDSKPVSFLQNTLSHDKQKRVCTREKLLLDGVAKTANSQNVARAWQGGSIFQPQSGIQYPLEFIDYGATYYRDFFLDYDHHNFFGVDEKVGPVAVSLRREKVPDSLLDFYMVPSNLATSLPRHQYRIIVRTSQLTVLRGTVVEDVIPSVSKAGTSKGLPYKDVVDYVCQGEVQMSCLKLGKADKKVQQELLRLDEQELNNKYKIGILYCKSGQSSEEEMYNNECGSAAFDEFLKLLGDKVKMKGFTKYRAQLDHKTDTTGVHSVYTEFRDSEIMFHVSTLLPHTPSNKQQLLRKRHIGNDIVTVVFQEPGSKPFSPKWIRSHFQHIFVVVRVENPNSAYTKYRVAISRSEDIPYFGPPLPDGGVFDKNELFREFLLTKMINACNASLRNKKFSSMAVRTRRQYLCDLAENCATNTTIEQSGVTGIVGLIKNFGGKKKDKMRQFGPLLFTPGAFTWPVSIILRGGRPLPFSEEHDMSIECIIGVAPDLLVFVDTSTKETVLHIPTKDISGWLQDRTRITIFYDESYCVCLESSEGEDEMKDLTFRLQILAPAVSSSHEATLMEFVRGGNGLLGFVINEAGVVQRVDGKAKSSGLTAHSRMLQVEDRLLCSHSHSQIMELLHARHKISVKVFVIPPPNLVQRELLFYCPLDWNAIWSVRPSMTLSGESEDSCKRRDGSATPEPMEVHVQERKFEKFERKTSVTNRMSYVEATTEGDNMWKRSTERLEVRIDDDEPLYDRLRNFDPTKVTVRNQKPPRSPRPNRDANPGFSRVRRTQRALRESVVQFADDLMEKTMSFSQGTISPEPVDHTVESYSPTVDMQIARSVAIPDNKAHTALPLSSLKDQRGRDVSPASGEVPLTPGQVHELTKRFSFPANNTSKIPVARHVSPARASIPADSANPGMPTRAKTDEAIEQSPVVVLRANRKSSKMRPASWDVSLILGKEVDFAKNGAVSGALIDDSSAPSFSRHSNVRTPVRRNKYGSYRDLHSSSEDDTPVLPTDHLGKAFFSKPKDPSMSVRERTKQWEERGGGVPSYFSTLPRSFRARSTSATSPPSRIPTATSRGKMSLPSSAYPDMQLDSQDGLPHSSSRIPVPTVRSSDGDSVKSDVQTPQIRQNHMKGPGKKSMTPFSHKSRGQTLLPTRAFSTSTLPGNLRSSRIHGVGSVSTGAPKASEAANINESNFQQSDDLGHHNLTAQDETLGGIQTQFEQLSVDNSEEPLQPTTSKCPRNIEEWIRETNASAGPLPDLELPREGPGADHPEVGSPTYTDGSLSFSCTSDCSFEALKQRVEFLENRLEKEAECNTDLKLKLRKAERQLQKKSVLV